MESGKKDEKSRFDDDDTDSDCQLNSHLDNEDKDVLKKGKSSTNYSSKTVSMKTKESLKTTRSEGNKGKKHLTDADEQADKTSATELNSNTRKAKNFPNEHDEDEAGQDSPNEDHSKTRESSKKQLPLDIDDYSNFESEIWKQLRTEKQLHVVSIKLLKNLGVGIVKLQSKKDRSCLIDDIKSLTIRTTKNYPISFVDSIDIVSYIVIVVSDTDDDQLPTVEEIKKVYCQEYKITEDTDFQLVSIHYPNIFRATFKFSEDLFEITDGAQFDINETTARVYFNADCCFFGDLPQNLKEKHIKDAIRSSSPNIKLTKKSFHIQYNAKASVAIVINSRESPLWASKTSIEIDGKVFERRKNIVYRLLIQNVPTEVNTNDIVHHPHFKNKVIQATRDGDHYIVEISDINVFQDSVNNGALKIRQKLCDVVSYTDAYASRSEIGDIDARSWYDTDMQQMKPDIMPFISQPRHKIFRMKWNPKAYLEQYNLCQTKTSTDTKDHANRIRHLLRVTAMLNTIAAVEEGFYFVRDTKVEIRNEQLKTIVYNHDSKLDEPIEIALADPKRFEYPKTSVRVINKDCLVVYDDLVRKRCKPLLLNMANGVYVGGGYKRGDGAQEENLFRRSNYYRSLDADLDQGKNSERCYCTSSCATHPLDMKKRPLYPMDEFGAIYTSGLTFFRNTENTGYEYMREPQYNVCALAVAAYPNPKTEGNRLNRKYSLCTRKKIENIFKIAYHNEHDSLVLSAFGCGAFKNPVEHIADIFFSVIEQFAGYFRYIYFAIMDDHNTGHRHNPDGNFHIFQKLLDNQEFEPRRKATIGSMTGPRCIIESSSDDKLSLSDIRIFEGSICEFGGLCERIEDRRHRQEQTHPSLCPDARNGNQCKRISDAQHRLWFRHDKVSEDLDDRDLIGKDSNQYETSPKPSRRSDHHNTGKNDSMGNAFHEPRKRENTRKSVLSESDDEPNQAHGASAAALSVQSPIPCRYGVHCRDKKDAKHCAKYIHPDDEQHASSSKQNKINCRHGTNCRDKKDSKHCVKYAHPDDDDEKLYSSKREKITCRYGTQCRNKNDPNHVSRYDHPDDIENQRQSKISPSIPKVAGPISSGKRSGVNTRTINSSSSDDDTNRKNHRKLQESQKPYCGSGHHCTDTSLKHRSSYSHSNK